MAWRSWGEVIVDDGMLMIRLAVLAYLQLAACSMIFELFSRVEKE
jgi:hypothetical protein